MKSLFTILLVFLMSLPVWGVTQDELEVFNKIYKKAKIEDRIIIEKANRLSRATDDEKIKLCNEIANHYKRAAKHLLGN